VFAYAVYILSQSYKARWCSRNALEFNWYNLSRGG